MTHVRYTIHVRYTPNDTVDSMLTAFLVESAEPVSGLVGCGGAGMSFQAVEARDVAVAELGRLLDGFDATITTGQTLK